MGPSPETGSGPGAGPGFSVGLGIGPGPGSAIGPAVGFGQITVLTPVPVLAQAQDALETGHMYSENVTGLHT